jgi:hypothetical protein
LDPGLPRSTGLGPTWSPTAGPHARGVHTTQAERHAVWRAGRRGHAAWSTATPYRQNTSATSTSAWRRGAGVVAETTASRHRRSWRLAARSRGADRWIDRPLPVPLLGEKSCAPTRSACLRAVAPVERWAEAGQVCEGPAQGRPTVLGC